MSRLLGLCISREFYLFAAGKSSPVVEWLKELARLAHHECGELGVGAVGMCLTGNFAMAMAVEPDVLVRRELGSGFIGTTLPDNAANTKGRKLPHSVFTTELIDAAGQPTRAAVDEVIGFFRERLRAPTNATG